MHYFTTPTGIALLIFVMNLPFGAWRARLRQLSPHSARSPHLRHELAIRGLAGSAPEALARLVRSDPLAGAADDRDADPDGSAVPPHHSATLHISVLPWSARRGAPTSADRGVALRTLCRFLTGAWWTRLCNPSRRPSMSRLLPTCLAAPALVLAV